MLKPFGEEMGYNHIHAWAKGEAAVSKLLLFDPPERLGY